MQVIFNVTGLIVGAAILVIGGLFAIGSVVYMYIREWWYDKKRCPHCKKRHNCFRNYMQSCTKGFKKEN